MSEVDRAWFISAYDQVVAEHPEGIRYRDAKRIVLERFSERVADQREIGGAR